MLRVLSDACIIPLRPGVKVSPESSVLTLSWKGRTNEISKVSSGSVKKMGAEEQLRRELCFSQL